MPRCLRLRPEVEKGSASTAVECGLAARESSGIVHRWNKGLPPEKERGENGDEEGCAPKRLPLHAPMGEWCEDLQQQTGSHP